MMINALIFVSFLAALVPFAFVRPEYTTRAASFMSTIIFALSLAVGMPVLLGANPLSWGEVWYVDSFAALLVVLIGTAQWTATLASRSFLLEEVREGVVAKPLVRRFYVFLALFVLAMLVTVVSDNLGLLWVALEATTLATTFLVAFYGRASSLEAAWKYLIICSTGIALAFIGFLLVSAAASQSGAIVAISGLRWSTLLLAAPTFSPSIMRFAFVFALVGFGTKVGLAQMHMWKP
ncbi:MAG TPA: proton-conducting transporter membrane subunit, partial [Candidatus Paceibacterota bacterium]